MLRTDSSTRALYGLLINWGCSRLPLTVAPGQTVLNQPAAIQLASCKLSTLRAFKQAEVPHPQFWDQGNKQEIDRSSIIIARLTTRGSGGEGIVVIRPDDTVVPEAPLYTRYIRKLSEYRIHVVRGEVLLIQQKRRDSEAEQDQNQKLIRNYDNGWVFASVNVEFTSDEQKTNCEQAAITAVRSLGLDFGAVDIVVSRRDGLPYVLEVNTAPGIQSPTLLELYATAFKRIAGELNYEQPASRRVVRSRNVPR